MDHREERATPRASMPSINEIVERELAGPHANALSEALAQSARESLGRYACGLLDIDRPAVGGDWLRFDEPQHRMEVIEQDSQLFARCTELLEAVIDPIRTAVRAEGYGKQGLASMRPRLTAVIPALMTRPMNVAQLLASPFSENWAFTGDELGRRLCSILRASPNGASPPEWLVMNYLILAEYVSVIRTPS
jgi:hypothetical protein